MSPFHSDRPPPVKNRGAGANPANQFKTLDHVPDPEGTDPDAPAPRTQFLADASRSILNRNDSPDVGFDVGLNPYRGCEHGCIYCYARTTHEYFEMSAGLDFETKILVKQSAPELLEKELASPRWVPQVIALSGVTDVYQPGEKRFGITRKCLEVLLEFRNPVAIITKNHGVTRDIDLLRQLTAHRCVAVFISVTTLDAQLSRRMEPRASLPEQRLAAIAELHRAGVPVGVLAAPVVPGLTDHEMPAILKAAADSGAGFSGYIVLRLPYGVKELFADWLERHYPDKKRKVLNRIQALRGGKLNDPQFGSRMKGEGIFAEQIARMYQVAARRSGIAGGAPALTTRKFRNARKRQMDLF